jgi:hypothetical protein
MPNQSCMAVPSMTHSHVSLPALSDGRVLLRAAEPRDLPAIEAGIHDPDVIQWIGDKRRAREPRVARPSLPPGGLSRYLIT